jgi:hypothetical protein
MVGFDFEIQGEDAGRKITIQETAVGNNENQTADFGGSLRFCLSEGMCQTKRTVDRCGGGTTFAGALRPRL